MRSMLTRCFPILCLFMLVLASCSVPGVPATDAQLPAAQAITALGALPPVRFPQDEAPHRDLTEWWYYTGHLDAVAPDGQTHHYGFEFVFFQALRSDYPALYPAHFAITDLTRGEFHYDQRRLIEPNAVIPNGTSSAGFNISVGDWSIRGLNGQDHLQASIAGYTINLDLSGLKPPTLHNGNGLIAYGPGGFSYYYSRTRMAVSGTLLDHAQKLSVTGTAWMDHQWGNFLTLGGGGWDWFSVQLNAQSEMMFYLLRDASGNITSTYADYIGSDKQIQQISSNALHVDVLDHWTSPVTGITYPSGWHLQINSPQLQVALTLQPELKDQELVTTQTTGNTYWEGAVSIQGQSGGQAVQGEGYVELTGYQK